MSFAILYECLVVQDGSSIIFADFLHAGFDIFTRLGADSWMQTAKALDLLQPGAQRSGMAIVPELDRGNRLPFGGMPACWPTAGFGMRQPSMWQQPGSCGAFHTERLGLSTGALPGLAFLVATRRTSSITRLCAFAACRLSRSAAGSAGLPVTWLWQACCWMSSIRFCPARK